MNFTGSKIRVLVLSLIIGSFVGFITESIQYFVPYRYADIIDWFIDTIGSFLGSFFAFMKVFKRF